LTHWRWWKNVQNGSNIAADRTVAEGNKENWWKEFFKYTM
jgi:hypothetical protein